MLIIESTNFNSTDMEQVAFAQSLYFYLGLKSDHFHETTGLLN